MLAAQTLLAIERTGRGNAPLKTQLSRSIASVPANIAEGAAQSSNAKYAHFLSIALGSLTESHNHVLLLRAVGTMTAADTAHLTELINALRPALIRLQQVVISHANPTHDARLPTHDSAAHDPQLTTPPQLKRSS